MHPVSKGQPDRYYIDPKVHELDHTFWLREPRLYQIWTREKRYRPGDEVVLFDGISHERLYQITHVERDACHVEMVTEYKRNLPKHHVYLFWARLGNAADERVIKQGTELGVTNFVPLLTTHSEEGSMELERLQAEATEVAVSAGRSDLPHLRQPITLWELADNYAKDVQLLLCVEPPAGPGKKTAKQPKVDPKKPVGIIVGPDQGWTERERELLKKMHVAALPLSQLNLKSETVAIVAAVKLLH